MRINYNLNTLDSVGHGVHVPEPEDFMHKKRALTAPSEPDGPSPAVVQQEQMQRDRITRQRGESIRSMVRFCPLSCSGMTSLFWYCFFQRQHRTSKEAMRDEFFLVNASCIIKENISIRFIVMGW